MWEDYNCKGTTFPRLFHRYFFCIAPSLQKDFLFFPRREALFRIVAWRRG